MRRFRQLFAAARSTGNSIDSVRSHIGLEEFGLKNTGAQHWNLRTSQLYEHVARNQEGQVVFKGSLAVRTGNFTGRAAKDKHVVDHKETTDQVWWNVSSRKMPVPIYVNLRHRMLAYLQMRDLYIQDCFLGKNKETRLRVRVVTEQAWHSLFVRNMYVRATDEELKDFEPDLVIWHAPGFEASKEIDQTASGAAVVLSLPGCTGFTNVPTKHGTVLICGTSYAGEIKKAGFSIMNYLLPQKGILPMHAACNVNEKTGDSAIFFGLSGTGKTTLSAEADRKLIGDDEHGWHDGGVFNLEGGCYAKTLKLSQKAEPEIYNATRMFGTVLENVVVDPWTRKPDFDDATYTENGRAAYKISSINNVIEGGEAGHPTKIIFLTCDAFGVLPPMSRLNESQAMYHFISGYTAKVAGTEVGVTEPSATFSACFGGPFMLRQPIEYAQLLAARMKKHNAECWLVNTGWSGGGIEEGSRMPISTSRACIRAIMESDGSTFTMRKDSNFGFEVPTAVQGVAADALNPRESWKDGAKYDEAAKKLIGLFHDNFEQFKDHAPPSLLDGAPKTG